jgi:uncharacterized membrane protein YqjE
MRREHHEGWMGSAALRWGLAGLVAIAALIGILTLVVAVVLVLQPAEWIQSVLGAGLALGSGALAWLVSTALRSAHNRDHKARW